MPRYNTVSAWHPLQCNVDRCKVVGYYSQLVGYYSQLVGYYSQLQ